eukprot:COSAG03_NODE_380_length_8364_cov_20.212099_6_plen_64_part_00
MQVTQTVVVPPGDVRHQRLVRRRASSRGLISDQLELLKLQVAIVYRYLYRVDDDARVPLHYAL